MAYNPKTQWKKRARNYGSRYLGPPHYAEFINIVAATGSIPFARKQCALTPNDISDRRDRYPEFAQEVMDALEYFNSAVIEGAAITRAVDGVKTPLMYQGKATGEFEIKYSDGLLSKLMDGTNPEKYRPQQTGNGGNTNNFTVILQPELAGILGPVRHQQIEHQAADGTAAAVREPAITHAPGGGST